MSRWDKRFSQAWLFSTTSPSETWRENQLSTAPKTTSTERALSITAASISRPCLERFEHAYA
jgi:hypothetical protein